MASVFSGEGLGLFNSSYSQLGQFTNSLSGNKQSSGYAVNVSTGNLVVKSLDQTLKALGNDFTFTRTYNSLGDFDGDNNDNWRLGFIKSLDIIGANNSTSSTAYRINADGFKQKFEWDAASSQYVSTQGTGSHDTLTINNDGTYTVSIDGGQVVETYNADRKLIQLRDRLGNFTEIDYQNGRVDAIRLHSDGEEESIHLQYEGGNVARVYINNNDQTFRRSYYEYDDENRLSAYVVDLTPEDSNIEDKNVSRTEYSYHGTSNQLESISTNVIRNENDVIVSESRTSFTYHENGRVHSITDPNDVQTIITYGFADGLHQTRVKIEGVSVLYRHDNDKNLREVIQNESGQEIKQTFTYTDTQNTSGVKLKSITDSLNNNHEFTYDTRGNLIHEKLEDGSTIKRYYNDDDQIIAEIKGDQFNEYYYDELGRLDKFIDGSGVVTRYKYGDLGAIADLRTQPVRVETLKQRFTSNKVENYFADYDATKHAENLQRYNAQINDSTALLETRNIYEYDFRGQLKYSREAGVEMEYIYDFQGRLERKSEKIDEVPRNAGGVTSVYAHTNYYYDGLGRLTSIEDAKGHITSYQYSADSLQKTTTHANGLIEQAVYDKIGNLISIIKGTDTNSNKFGEEQFYYNHNGDLIGQVNADTTREFAIFNELNQLEYSIDKRGQLTSYVYDTEGRITQQTVYGGEPLLNTTQWQFDNTTLIKADIANFIASDINTDKHRTTYTFYDESDRVIFSVDGENYVTEYTYNSLGQIKYETLYSHSIENAPITETAIYEFIAFGKKVYEDRYIYQKDFTQTEYIYNSSWQIEKTEITKHFYEGEDGWHFIQKEQGKTTQFTYNSQGNVTSKTVFQDTDQERDTKQTQYWVYNLDGQLQYSIDEYGALTEYRYDFRGNKVATRSYNQRIDYTLNGSISLPQGGFIETAFRYDDNNNLILEQQANGSATLYEYNAANQVIRTTTGSLAELEKLLLQTGTVEGDKTTFTSEPQLFELPNELPSGVRYDENGLTIDSTLVSADGVDYLGSKPISTELGHGIQYTFSTGENVNHLDIFLGIHNGQSWTSGKQDRYGIELSNHRVAAVNYANSRYGDFNTLDEGFIKPNSTYQLTLEKTDTGYAISLFNTSEPAVKLTHHIQQDVNWGDKVYGYIAADNDGTPLTDTTDLTVTGIKQVNRSHVITANTNIFEDFQQTQQIFSLEDLNAEGVEVSSEGLNFHTKSNALIAQTLLSSNKVSTAPDTRLSFDISTSTLSDTRDISIGLHSGDSWSSNNQSRFVVNVTNSSISIKTYENSSFKDYYYLSNSFLEENSEYTITFDFSDEHVAVNFVNKNDPSDVLSKTIYTGTVWNQNAHIYLNNEVSQTSQFVGQTDGLITLNAITHGTYSTQTTEQVLGQQDFNAPDPIFSTQNLQTEGIRTQNDVIEFQSNANSATDFSIISDLVLDTTNSLTQFTLSTNENVDFADFAIAIHNGQSWGSGKQDRINLGFSGNQVIIKEFADSAYLDKTTLSETFFEPSQTYRVSLAFDNNQLTITIENTQNSAISPLQFTKTLPLGFIQPGAQGVHLYLANTTTAITTNVPESNTLITMSDLVVTNGGVSFNPSVDQDKIRQNTFVYDELGRQIKVLDAIQSQTLFGLNGSNYSSAIETTKNKTIYDLSGNIVEQYDNVGNRTAYLYKPNGDLWFIVNAEGEVVEFTYNAFGQQTTQRSYATTLSASQMLQLQGGSYSEQTLPSFLPVKSNNDTIEQWQYNRAAQLATHTAAHFVDTDTPFKRSYTYNGYGQAIEINKDVQFSSNSSIKNFRHRNFYDLFGNLSESTEVAGQVYKYDVFGRVINKRRNSYDDWSIISAFTYDQGVDPLTRNRISENVSGKGTTTVEYDMHGRKSKVRDVYGNETLYEYDLNANTITITAPNNTSTIQYLNEFSEVYKTEVRDKNNQLLRKTETQFDANGNVTYIYLSDDSGNIKQVTRKEYDENNNLQFQVDANGTRIDYEYDGLNRLTLKTTDENGLAIKTGWEYGQSGRLVTETLYDNQNGNQLTRIEYDAQGRVLKTISGDLSNTAEQEVTQYQYDQDGKVLSIIKGTGSNEVKSTYTYDETGQLVLQIENGTYTEFYYEDGLLMFQVESIHNMVNNFEEVSTGTERVTYFHYDFEYRLTRKVTTSELLYSENEEGEEVPIQYGKVTNYKYDSVGNLIAEATFNKPVVLAEPADYDLNRISTSEKLEYLIGYNEEFIDHDNAVYFPEFSMSSDNWTVKGQQYDELGRVKLVISETGVVTQNRYDDLNRVIEQTTHSQYVNREHLFTYWRDSEFYASLYHDSDIKTATVYNNENSARFTLELVDSQSNTARIKESKYDEVGNLVQTTVYSQYIDYKADYTEEEIVELLASLNDEGTRQTEFFYDAANRLRFTVDNNNQVSETKYNNAGQVIETISYAQPLTTTAPLSYNQLLAEYPQNHILVAQDRVTKYRYDSVGRLEREINAENHSEQYTYYNNGQKSTFTNRKGAQWQYIYNSDGLLHKEIGPQTTVDMLNASNQVVTLENVFQVKEFKYDESGNVVEITEGLQQPDLNSTSEPQISWVPGIEQRVTDYYYNKSGEQRFSHQYSSSSLNNGSISSSTTNYDTLGRAVSASTYKETGSTKQYKVFNNLNQIRFEIDGEGGVTEYRYNALGQQVELIRYANTANVPDKTPLISDIVQPNGELIESFIAPSSNDRVINTFYDQLGRKQATLQGSVLKRFYYNEFNELIKTQTVESTNYTQQGSGFQPLSDWVKYANPDAMTLSKHYDETLEKPVVSIKSSDGLFAGVRLDFAAGTNDNYVSWEYQSNERSYPRFFIKVETNQGPYYLQYEEASGDPSMEGNYIRLALPYQPKNGQWNTIQRDIAADLKQFLPEDIQISSISSFFVKGTVVVGDVMSHNEFYNAQINGNDPIEAWDKYSQPENLTITKRFDETLGKQVFDFKSETGLAAGARFDLPDNTNDRYVSWDYQSNPNTYPRFFLKVQTSQGQFYIQYEESDKSPSLDGDYIRFSLPYTSLDGKWHTMTRDVEADLQRVLPPHTKLESIDTFFVRGSTTVSEVRSYNALEPTLTTLESNLFYNESGQKVAEIDEAGYITRFEYDAFGQVDYKVEYAQALSSSQIAQFDLTQLPTALQKNDRVFRFVYDNLGRVTHQIQTNLEVYGNSVNGSAATPQDALVTFTTYDELGNVTNEVKQAANSALLESDPLAYINKTNFDQSKANVSNYDDQGRLISTYTAEFVAAGSELNNLRATDIQIEKVRSVHQFGYDQFGNLVSQSKYGETVTGVGEDSIVTPHLDTQQQTLHQYNAIGQLVKTIDAQGHITNYEYNDAGQLIHTTEQFTTVETNSPLVFTYTKVILRNIEDGTFNEPGTGIDGEGLPFGFSFNIETGEIKREGHLGNVIYDITVSGPTSLIGNGEQTYTFSNNAKSHVIAGYADAIANTSPYQQTDYEKKTSYVYDNNNQLVETSTQRTKVEEGIPPYKREVEEQVVESWRYNTFGELAEDNNGVYVYDNSGLLVKSTQGDGVLKTHAYNLAGQLIATTNASTGTTVFERDALGRAIRVVQPGNTTSDNQAIVHHYKYDRWGNVIEYIDAENSKISQSYNHLNQVTQETFANVAVTNDQGAKQVVDVANAYRYDKHGNIVSKNEGFIANSEQTGNVHYFNYDELSQLTSQQDATGATTTHFYDALGRKIGAVDAINNVTTITYNELDQVTETGRNGLIDGVYSYQALNRYQYDELGYRTHETDAVNNTIRYFYSVTGEKVSSTDEQGRTKHYAFMRQQDETGKAHFSFEHLGKGDFTQPITQEEINLNKTAVSVNYREYDAFKRITKLNDLSNTETTYTYEQTVGLDSNGNEITVNSSFLSRQESDHGQDLTYAYYDNGRLKSITDHTTGAETQYEYDKMGRITREVKDAKDDLERFIRVETKTTYDSRGRITQVQTFTDKKVPLSLSDPTNPELKWSGNLKKVLEVNYEYDIHGNRRKLTIDNQASVNTNNHQSEEYWFTYDANNRVEIDGGMLDETNTISIATQGQKIEYNAIGQKEFVIFDGGEEAEHYLYNSWSQQVLVERFFNKSNENILASGVYRDVGNEAYIKNREFDYDALGRVIKTYQYFDPGRFEIVEVDLTERRSTDDNTQKVKVDYSGALSSIQYTDYNKTGEVTYTEELSLRMSITDYLEKMDFDTTIPVNGRYYFDNPWDESDFTTFSETKNFEYDGATNLKKFSYTQYKGLPNGESDPFTHNFEKHYANRDRYIEEKTSGTGTTNFKPDATFSHIDVNGNVTRVEERNENEGTGVSARYFRLDAQGNMLSKVTGTQTDLLDSIRPSGETSSSDPFGGPGEPEEIEPESKLAEAANFVEHTFNGSSAGSYFIHAAGNYLGEVNKSGTNTIKQQHYSSPTADEVAVIARHQVRQGETLQTIAKLYYGSEDLWYVIADANGIGAGETLANNTSLDIPARQNVANASDSFKPLNLAQAIGDTTPALPYVPPPPEAGCNAVASIIMIAVSVAVTAMTSGAAIGLTNTVLGSAIGAAAGSAASQVVGMALGVQDSFSFKQVGIAAVGGAITGGISELAGVGPESALVQKPKNLSSLANWTAVTKQAGVEVGRVTLNGLGRAVSAAASSMGTALASKIAYGQSSFNWANVAASSVTAALGGRLPGEGVTTSFDFVDDFVVGVGRSAVGYGVNRAFGGNRSWNFGQVALDSFGNALGNSIVAKMQEQPTTNKKSSNSNQAALDSSDPVATSNTMSDGVNTSQGAVNINPENALERWNRLEASGGLESLSHDEYDSLAAAANAIENAMSPVSSFYRFNRVVNSTNQYAAKLAADASRKQYNVDMMKLRVSNNQAWVSQNTNELGGITQGFDLEAMIGLNTDWTDMSYDHTPGPWREGYVFGASTLSKPSALTQKLAQLSFFSGAYGTADSMLKGLSLTKYGNYGIGLMQSNGWSLADGAPSLSSLFDGGYNRISNTSIYGFGNPSSYFAISKVDDLFVNSGSVAKFINSSAVKTTGETISWLGPISSGLQAYDYNFLQNDGKGHSWEEHGVDNLSNYTKAVVDTAITGSAYFVGAIPAAIYGVTDFSLQYFDYSYTPKYHPTESGRPKKSWTGLGYLYFESQQNILENNQRVNSNWSLMNLGKI